MRIYFNRIFIGLMTLLIMCGTSIVVYAEDGISKNITGEIRLNFKYEGVSIKDGSFSIYKVADISEENGPYQIKATDEFKIFDGAFTDTTNKNLWKKLEDFINENNIKPQKTIENYGETIVFDHLSLGLYLIVQTDEAKGYTKVNSFLVSIPKLENGEYIYAIDATPKVETAVAEINPPNKPPENQLPQTGQLKWPIPILAVLGLLFFILGGSWISKGRQYEV